MYVVKSILHICAHKTSNYVPRKHAIQQNAKERKRRLINKSIPSMQSSIITHTLVMLLQRKCSCEYCQVTQLVANTIPQTLYENKCNPRQIHGKCVDRHTHNGHDKRSHEDNYRLSCHNFGRNISLGATVQPLIFNICDNTDKVRVKCFPSSAERAYREYFRVSFGIASTRYNI